MIFNYTSGFQELDKEKVHINHREAVRAVIMNGDNILMVHTNKGDYKFPGGGANKEESHEQVLKREVREETGYVINDVGDRIGVFTERKLDEYEENSVFEMVSYYYLCEISDNKTAQQLDDYESELDFQPVWITLDKAIHSNEETLKKDSKGRNSWAQRETDVLRALKEYFL